jgi:thiamine-phosphate pyrophosphorylase
MARCYSEPVSKRYPSLPSLWLVSDARNDAVLEAALARMPRGSGLVFRHYHLSPAERRARFENLRRIARRRGHLVFLSSDVRTARAWRADGAYGPAKQLTRGPALPRLVTAHSLRELRTSRADVLILSPVFATRSHPAAKPLGPVRFRLLARQVQAPVVALGGMSARRAAALKPAAWAAIDGLAGKSASGGICRILDEESP